MIKTVKNKNLLLLFVLKCLFSYNIYGYLIGAGCIVFAFCTLHSYFYLIGFYKLLVALFFVCLCLNFYFFCKYLSRFPYKYKYFRVNYHRLQKKPFNEDWFKYDMSEPCMRLIIKDLCHQFGYTNEYKNLLKYSKQSERLEEKKRQLLEDVKNKIEKGEIRV